MDELILMTDDEMFNIFLPAQAESLIELKNRMRTEHVQLTPLIDVIDQTSHAYLFAAQGLPFPRNVLGMVKMPWNDTDRMMAAILYARAKNTHQQRFRIYITLHIAESANLATDINAVIRILMNDLGISTQNLLSIDTAVHLLESHMPESWAIMIEEV